MLVAFIVVERFYKCINKAVLYLFISVSILYVHMLMFMNGLNFDTQSFVLYYKKHNKVCWMFITILDVVLVSNKKNLEFTEYSLLMQPLNSVLIVIAKYCY